MSTVNPKISTINVFKITIFLLIILAGLSVIEFNLFFKHQKTTSVCLSDYLTDKIKGCFQVELAENPFQQEKGLMYRTSLDKDKGMLFIFNKEANYPFWMKNTLIPLDMIWIDRNSEVVFIKENAEPCLPAQAGVSDDCPAINPERNAKYVLEINGGLAREINLGIGDTTSIID